MSVNGFSRILVGDRFGNVLTELQPLPGAISWRHNDVGSFSFKIRRGDSKATAENLRFGNRVYVEFDNGLPAWGGIIEPPRGWTVDEIGVTVYSAEYLLGLRHTIKERQFVAQTAGEMFRALIDEANAVADMGISLGEVWDGGSTYSITFQFVDLLTAIRDDLCGDLAGADFAIRPVLSNGRISFTANLYEDRGRDLPNIVLIEGHNTANESLSEYGPIYNWLDLAGAGSSWGDDRITSLAVDPDSQAMYDLRQKAFIFSNIDTQATLDAQADNLLVDYKDPKNVISVSALNLEPASFSDYDVGDRIRVMLHSHGFDGTDTNVKVLTREYFPVDGQCNLVVEEV